MIEMGALLVRTERVSTRTNLAGSTAVNWVNARVVDQERHTITSPVGTQMDGAVHLHKKSRHFDGSS